MNSGIFTILFLTTGWVIFLATLAFYFICIEIGFLLGNHSRKNKNNKRVERRSNLMTIQAAVLGLLALILGFTFSMAITRYEHRKELIVEEANAIGTAYLRTDILKEPDRRELQSLLKQYLDNRLEFQTVGIEQNKIATALGHSNELQRKLWNQAIKTADQDPRFPVYSLLLPSLNQVIDLHSNRLQAAINRVPDLILYMIFLIAGLALALTGYVTGLDGVRSLFATTVLALIISAVTFVIIDLDRPRRGLIVEKDISLIELRENLSKEK